MAYTPRHRRLSCEELEAKLCLSGVSFASHVLTATHVVRPASVYAADLDSDGDVDVLSASAGDRKIAWYENIDGMGNFGPQKVLATTAEEAQWVHAADIDNDGDPDVLSASYGTIAWYENTDGAGSFGQENVVAEKPTSGDLGGVRVADVNGDGNLDVFAAIGTRIVWYENTDGSGRYGQQRVVASAATPPTSLQAADLDNDDDLDIVSSFGNTVVWYENADGLGGFARENVIATPTVGPHTVHAADIDGDGDADVLSATWFPPWPNETTPKIAWYENTDGGGTFGPGRAISTTQTDARLMQPADVDGDGDVDVLSASWDDAIRWYENTDGTGAFADRKIITSDAAEATSMYAADLNADGGVDILFASMLDKISWYENLSSKSAAGDANRDGQFSQLDIVQVLQSSKYLTDQPATWEQGDWNGDGVFNQLDLVLALQEGNYLLEASYCWNNEMCGDDEYCYFADCAMETGECQPRPAACTREWDPVCGCDGETYGNECTAAAAGVSVDHRGECGRDAVVQ